MQILYRRPTIISIAVAIFLSFASAVYSQSNLESRILHVSGTGEVSLPTVYTEIRLGVENQAKTAQEAHRQTAKNSNQLVTFLKSKKVLNLQTTGVSLQPVYKVSKSSDSAITAQEYKATNMVSFRVKTEDAGAIIDGAVKEGASRIDRLTFLPEDVELEKAKKEVLRKAVQDAKSQAEVVLVSLGLTMKEVNQIHIDQNSVRPLLQTAMRADTTPIVGGDAIITARVSLQIKY